MQLISLHLGENLAKIASVLQHKALLNWLQLGHKPVSYKTTVARDNPKLVQFHFQPVCQRDHIAIRFPSYRFRR